MRCPEVSEKITMGMYPECWRCGHKTTKLFDFPRDINRMTEIMLRWGSLSYPWRLDPQDGGSNPPLGTLNLKVII